MSKDRDYQQNRANFQNRRNNYTPYNRNNYGQNEFNPRKNNFIKLNETNALIYIHPYSSYNQPIPDITKPKEIGILLSESKLLYILNCIKVFKKLHLERVIEIESKKQINDKYEKHKGIKYLGNYSKKNINQILKYFYKLYRMIVKI